MHVTLIGQYNPYKEGIGGIEVYIRELYTQLKDKGIDTLLVGWSCRKESIEGFIPVKVSEKMRGMVFSLNLFIKAPFMRIPKDSIIHVHRPDHILAFALRKNRIICTLHGAHMENVKLKKGKLLYYAYAFFQKYALRRADRIISVSESNRKFFSRLYPEIDAKMTVIAPGFNPAFKPFDRKACRRKFGFSSKDRIILYVGRLEKEKQVDVLINNLKGSAYKLVIAGEGREEQALRSQAEGYRNIIFLPPQKHTDVAKLMCASDATIMFSKFEGMPTTVLESMACGVPVLSTDVGDVKRVVVEGKTGFIIDESNMMQRIHAVCKSDFSKRCIAMSKEYAWRRIASDIISEYEKAD